jgi:hypothetical protein
MVSTRKDSESCSNVSPFEIGSSRSIVNRRSPPPFETISTS